MTSDRAMLRIGAILLAVCAVSGLGESRAQDGPELALLKAAETVFTNRIRDAEPSVVAIARFRGDGNFDPQDLFGPRPRGLEEPRGRPEELPPSNLIPNEFGAGIIIRDDGYILTMYHVVRGGPNKSGLTGDTRLVVRLHDRRAVSAHIHAADPRSDLAVLKIEANDLKPLSLDFDGPLRKGQFAIGLGNPYALARDGSASASWGVIANIGRRADFEQPDETEESKSQTIHHLGTLLQLDMRLDLGTSGAPVLNLDGQLIGITTSMAAIVGYEKSVGFAVPVNPRIKRIVDDLLAGVEVGYGFLGIHSPVDVTAEQIINLPQDAPHRRGGATFGLVMANTPASNRLKNHDVILELGHRPTGRTETNWIPILGANDLMREVGLLPPGTEIELRLSRGGPQTPTMHTVPLTLGKWPVIDEEGIVAPNRPLWRGLYVDYTTARKRFVRRSLGIPTEAPQGVAVVEVEPDSPAARAEIQSGDVILQVNRTAVSSPRQFLDLVRDESRPVTLQLERRKVELPPN